MKKHLSRLDSETTYCGKNTITSKNGKRADKNCLVADFEKVTCKSCIRLYDKELGISTNQLDIGQTLSYWSKIICEPDCYSLLKSKFDDKDKQGCIVTATANPLLLIFRLGMHDQIIVPLLM